MRSDYILIICDMSNINDKCGGILEEMIFLFLFKICLTKCIIMLKLGILFKEKGWTSVWLLMIHF
ncbi:hypothetical protein BTR42_03335 [Streptococcus gallolyticus subsp. gallolyticus DSM 16831]|nr:hypothetical protein BTR42_03335 [Streptococcus gallolyticus subsp. gallolyticus DSM 16831]